MPFQIVDHLEYAPGCCKGCGLTRPGRYVDTLEFDEANARVYYCEHCVKDWALHLGILDGEVKVVERVREPNAEEVGRFVLGMVQAVGAQPAPPAEPAGAHKCPDCGRAFDHAMGLTAHMRTHKGRSA